MAGKTVENIDEESILDPFDMAFNEAIDEKPVDEKPVDEKPVDEKPVDEKPVDEKPVDEKPVDEKPVDEKPVDEKPTPDPLAEAIRRAEVAEAEAARLKQPVVETPEQIKDKETAVAAKAKAEEEWATFKADWKEPAEMMERMHTGIMAQVESMIASALGAFAEKNIAPIAQSYEKTEQQKFSDAITSVHADGLVLIGNGEVDKWIATLPAYLQIGVNKVLDSGSPADVNAVLDDFKKATGKVAATPPAKTAAELAAEEEAKAEKARRRAGLSVVPDKRSVVTGDTDPDDFDGAFKQAVASS